MPFDPQAQNQLCNGCNRLLALGGFPIQDSMPPQAQPFSSGSDTYSSFSQSPVTPTNYQGFSYSTSPQTPMTPMNYQGFTYSNNPQPTETPQSYSYTGYSPSPQNMMTPSGLKRKHISEDEYGHDGEYPNKRSFGNAYAPTTPSGLRQNAQPASIDSNEAVDASSKNGEEDAEEGEEFVDAQEDQSMDVQPALSVEQEVAEAGAGEEASEGEDVVATEKVQDPTSAAEKGVEEIEEHPAEEKHEDDDDDDLFETRPSAAAPTRPKPDPPTTATPKTTTKRSSPVGRRPLLPSQPQQTSTTKPSSPPSPPTNPPPQILPRLNHPKSLPQKNPPQATSPSPSPPTSPTTSKNKPPSTPQP